MNKTWSVGDLAVLDFHGIELIVSIFDIFHDGLLARVNVMDDKFGSDTLTVELKKIKQIYNE